MKVFRWLTFAITPMCLWGTSAFSQSPSGPPPLDDTGFRTFMESCAYNIGNPAEVARYAKVNGFLPPPPDFASRLLKGEVGDVWVLPAPNGVGIVSLMGGLMCRVIIQQGDQEKIRRYFVRVIEGIARPEMFVRLYRDDDLSSSPPVHYLGYRVGPTDPKPGSVDRLFSLTTGTSPNVPFNIILSVSVAKSDLPIK